MVALLFYFQFQSLIFDLALKKYLRFIKIYRTAVRYQLGEFLEGIQQDRFITQFLRLLLKLPVANKVPRKDEGTDQNRGKRLRLALEELGPIFIKFGQLLSTRRDMIPDDIADELALLQDQVAPFSNEVAASLIEVALGNKIEALFSDFTREPLASASVAQVHAATLKTGEEVVVKVIRPGLEAIIEQDISLLETLASLIENYHVLGKRLHPKDLVRDYKLIIFDELNLLIEAANTSQLRRNFENSESLYVPKVYWDYCRSNVLVMERIYGIPVAQIEELKAANINFKKLAETGVEIFFTQVFNHSFFHADMHPGNVFVSREHPENPQYIALDCAIIGTLSKQDQQYLARNLLAIFQRDYRKVAELHVECGWVPPDTAVHGFEATMRSVCEPIFEKPLKDISFAMILLQLFRTASRYNMEVQPSLVLLQKTLINIEGLGKQLYPQLDLWQTALPFLEQWQRQRLSPLENLKIIQEKIPEWLERLPELPELIYDAITEAKHSRKNLEYLLDQYEKTRVNEQRKQSIKQLKFGIAALVSALIVSQIDVSGWSLASVILGLAGISLLYFRK